VSARLDASGHVLPLVDVTTLPGWRPGMPSFDAGQHVMWDVWTSRGDLAGAREVCGTQGALTW
jgi:hypothetical protein